MFQKKDNTAFPIKIVLFVLFLSIGIRIVGVSYLYKVTIANKDQYPRFFVEQDATGYFKIAANVIVQKEHNSYSRSLLYPLIIAGVGKIFGFDFLNIDINLNERDYSKAVFPLFSAKCLVLLNQVTGILKIFFIMLISWKIARSKTGVMAAGLFAALDTFNFYSDNNILPYAMGQFFTLLAVYCFQVWLEKIRLKWIVLTGVCLQVATLLLPAFMMIWGVLVLPVLFLRALSLKKKIQTLAVLIVCANLLTVAWGLRNYVRTGVFVYSSLQLRQFHNPIQNYVMVNKEKISLTKANQISEIPVQKAVQEKQQTMGRPLNELEIFQIDKEYALGYLLKNKGWWAVTHVKALTSYFVKWFSYKNTDGVDSRIMTFFRLGNLFCAVSIILAFFGIFGLIENREYAHAWVLGLLFLFFWNVASPHNAPRYIANWLIFSPVLIAQNWLFLSKGKTDAAE